jgi:uncharacterized protein
LKKQFIFLALALVTCLSLVGMACSAAPAPSKPAAPATPAAPAAPSAPAAAGQQVLTLVTMPPGTAVNAAGVSIIGAISSHTNVKVNLVPQTSEMVWAPLMVTKEADLGIATAFPMTDAYQGTFVFKKLAQAAGVKGFPIRLIACGSYITNTWCVRGDSPIKAAKDVKGYRLLWYPPDTFGDLGTRAGLAMEGLTPDDVTKIPVSNMLEAANALKDGRLDVADIGITTPAAAELAAAINLRYLPRSFTPEGWARYHEIAPVFYQKEVPGGIYPGVPNTMMMSVFDTYVVGRADLTDDQVYTITKAMWDYNNEVTATPMLKLWTKDKYVTENAWVPYHPGAIKFYKEQGVWTPAAETSNQKAIALAPK